MKKLIILAMSFSSVTAFGQYNPPAEDTVKHTRIEFTSSLSQYGSREFNDSIGSTLGLNLQVISTTQPNIGFDVGVDYTDYFENVTQTSRFKANAVSMKGGLIVLPAQGSFRFGVGLSEEVFNTETTNLTTSKTFINSVEVTSLNFNVGNRWSAGNFAIGCDWIGVKVPLSSQVADNGKTEADIVKEWVEWDANSPRVEFLKLTIGVAF